MKDDLQIIIAWNSNAPFLEEVERFFSNNIILKHQVCWSKEERAIKINELYYPIHVPHNSDRCQFLEPITLFLVKTNVKYKYFYRTEGFRLCNTEILNFKLEMRKRYNYTIFHCSDNIEETKKALKVFELQNYMPKASIVPVEQVYQIRHLNETNKYQIVPLQDCATVQYLMGYPYNELVQKYNLLYERDENNELRTPVQLETVSYLEQLDNFNQEHGLNKIEGFNYKNNYIITDGKHRASLFYFRGDRHLYIKESVPACSNEIIEKSIIKLSSGSHLEHFHNFIYDLHNNNVKYVVIRGFKTMPKTADTDLDMIIHPDDYEGFLKIIQKHINSNTMAFNVEKKYENGLWYRAFRTTGLFDTYLSNKNYQIDTYNKPFFLINETENISLSNQFLDYLFNNRLNFHNLYIPNHAAEMVLLFCRTYFDLNGNWKLKHKSRFDTLKVECKEDFLKLIKMALGDQHYLIEVAESQF